MMNAITFSHKRPFLLLAIFLLILFCVSRLGATEVPFPSPNIVDEAFEGAQAVYAADLDDDGDMDILGAAQGNGPNPGLITWWENTNGDGGSFTAHVIDSEVASGATSVYAADMDGDGDLDVLGALRFSSTNQFLWWENDGTPADGTWAEHVIDEGIGGAHSVYSADIDLDGDMDVVGAARTTGEIAWWENTGGNGLSWTKYSVDDAFAGAASVMTADINHDGNLDIIGAAATDGEIIWWQNDGSPTAVTGTDWVATTIDGDFAGALALYAADVDSDGDTDVLGAALEDGDITWWENTAGDGSNWNTHAIDANFESASSIYATDLDSDGDLDVLGAAIDINQISWWENDGTPATGEWLEHVVDADIERARWVYAADLNQDGDADVLGAAAGNLMSNNDIVWWDNQTIHGNAIYPLEQPIESDFTGAVDVYAADIDADGDLDVLGAARDANEIAWWQNDGTPNDGGWNKFLIGESFQGAYSLYPADIDADGFLDIVASAENTNDIKWWHNDGSPTDGGWTEFLVDGKFSGARQVFVIDVDADSDQDILAVAFNGNEVKWWENDGSPTVMTGSDWIAHPISAAFDSALAVHAADLDSDGDPDVIAAGTTGINWWEASPENGDGESWIEHTVESNLGNIFALLAADINSDGKIDIIGTSASGISWWDNSTGDGSTWDRQAIDSTFTGALSVEAADIDDDGDLDILAADFISQQISWWENTSADGQTWTAHSVDENFSQAASAYAADLDHDGKLDLLAAGANNITWWQNVGGQFSLTTTDTAPATLGAGTQDDLLSIQASHNGHSSDNSAELLTFDFLLEESPDAPLSTEEANNLIQSLNIYLDTGSGSYDSSDTLVTSVQTLTLSSGIQSVTFTDDDSNVELAAATSRTYFVVPLLTNNANTQSPNSFRITHLTAPEGTQSSAQDRSYNIPLTLAYIENTSSSIVTAITMPTPTNTPIGSSATATATATNTATNTATATPSVTGTPPTPTPTPTTCPGCPATFTPTTTGTPPTAIPTNTPPISNTPPITNTPSPTLALDETLYLPLIIKGD